ncbi:YetF domain-containing protein [Desulfosporosinus sp. BICA1-9]|nr:YetF domain-containing protein [Desulfosporosinus sp. BICA1-9]
MRQVGISSIEDVQYGTIEVSGQLGYSLKDNKKPLTKEDFYGFNG